MQLLDIYLFLATLPTVTIAHYTFGRLIFNNEWTETWEYVREISPKYTGGDAMTGLLFPNEDPTSTDIVCGRNATIAWNKPKTAKIKAGDRVGFAPGAPMLSTPEGVPRIYHQGIGSAWLSKSAVDDLNDYRGDGLWFKIESVLEPTEQSLDWSLPENKERYDPLYSQFGTYLVDSWNFTIPATTPPGKYLLRFEHIYPNRPEPLLDGIGAQFYPNCAHVEIINENPDVGEPGPLVKIPGVYDWAQPDIYYDTYVPGFNISDVKAPKPDPWKG